MSIEKKTLAQPDVLTFSVVLAVILAIFVAPAGLILGFALRRDYRDRPRNRMWATLAIWIGGVITLGYVGMAMIGPLLSIGWFFGIRW